MNSRFAKIHKKAHEQKLMRKRTILKSLKEKKNQISAQRSPDDCPDALDHLVIGLVTNKYTKLGKTSEKSHCANISMYVDSQV